METSTFELPYPGGQWTVKPKRSVRPRFVKLRLRSWPKLFIQWCRNRRIRWTTFAEAATVEAFCQSWLVLQCGMIGGVRAGLVLLGPPGRGPFRPDGDVAGRPA